MAMVLWNKKALQRVSLVVLGAILCLFGIYSPKAIQAQMLPAHELTSCCVYSEKTGEHIITRCEQVADESSCQAGSFQTERREYMTEACSQLEECASIGHSRDDVTKKTTTTPVFFTPNFTLPGSQFIAGQKILVTGSTLGEWIAAAYVFFVGIAGILATTMMIYGGIKYTVSFGNPSKLQDARDTITSAMIGLAIALGSYVILLTISPRLVTFQGLEKLGTTYALNKDEEVAAERAASGDKSGEVYELPPMSSLPPSNGQANVYGRVIRNTNIYDSLLRDYAGKQDPGIDPDYLKAIMLVESDGIADRVSRDKQGNILACGLMQLLPSTAGISCDELRRNPEKSISIAAAHLAHLYRNACPESTYPKIDKDGDGIKESRGPKVECDAKKSGCKIYDYKYAVAAYNGGEGANCNSRDCGDGFTWWECEIRGEGYIETRDYVKKVQYVAQLIKNGSFPWGN